MKPVDKIHVAVIGAGFSGLCIAIKLKEAGFDHISIYEKADNVGGTWRENTYPGVACDVASHLYSFSFEPKTDWTKVYSPGEEIQKYSEHIAEKYDLNRHMHFGKEFHAATYHDGKWQLEFAGGDTAEADYLVSCIGGLHVPSYPDIAGAELFEGHAFHTAVWDHSYDLSGKKVAIIGTAASALQLIPKIVDTVAQLDVYQRTPNWVVPRIEGAYSKTTKSLFKAVPFLAKIHRLFHYLLNEMRFPLFRQNAFFAKRATEMALTHLKEQVQDEELRKKLTPDYPLGCKRILASDTFFPALQKDNVELITDGIERLTKDGIICKNGTSRDVDTVIYATGFTPFSVVEHTEVIGRGGLSMTTYMTKGIRAHRTVALPGFPNYFMMLGPNSGLGHNSILLVIEAQAKYILQAIQAAAKCGAKSVEPKEAVSDAFNKDLQEDLQGTVWNGHCKSWYQNEQGHIFTLWPRGTINFRRALATFDPLEYDFEM